jgi:hypothetical protein
MVGNEYTRSSLGFHGHRSQDDCESVAPALRCRAALTPCEQSAHRPSRQVGAVTNRRRVTWWAKLS